MKILIIFASLAFMLTAVLWLATHHYTFTVTEDGQLLYRFNRLTGHLDYASPQYNIWTPIAETNSTTTH